MIVRIYNVFDNGIVEQNCKDYKDLKHFKNEFCARKAMQDKDMLIDGNVLYILAVPFSQEYNYEYLIPSYYKERIKRGI